MSRPSSAPTLLRSPPVRVTLTILALVLGALAVASRATSLGDTDLTRNDFTPDYVSATALLNGRDPYASLSSLVHYVGPNAPYYGPPSFDSRNVHPPALIVMVAPLSKLPYRTARIIWLALMAACSAAAIALTARHLGARTGNALVIGIGALALPVFQKDLVYGQSNGLLLLLLVVAWLQMKQRRDGVAGVALGLAIALKLFPALMAIPLIRMPRRRALASTIASSVIFSAVGVFLVGIGSTREFVKPATPVNFAFWRAAPMNLSLPGIAYRWLTSSRWRPGAANAPGIAAALAFALIALCVVAMFKTPARMSGRFWAAIPLMLLATPLMWETYLVFVVPSVMIAIARGNVSTPVLIAAAIAAIGIAPALPSPPRLVPDVAQVFGYALPTYALIALALSEWRARAPDARPAGEPAYSV